MCVGSFWYSLQIFSWMWMVWTHGQILPKIIMGMILAYNITEPLHASLSLSNTKVLFNLLWCYFFFRHFDIGLVHFFFFFCWFCSNFSFSVQLGKSFKTLKIELDSYMLVTQTFFIPSLHNHVVGVVQKQFLLFVYIGIQ